LKSTKALAPGFAVAANEASPAETVHGGREERPWAGIGRVQAVSPSYPGRISHGNLLHRSAFVEINEGTPRIETPP
jgi:hypothetical protein